MTVREAWRRMLAADAAVRAARNTQDYAAAERDAEHARREFTATPSTHHTRSAA